MQTITDTWVYLAQTPLLWLTITLIVYQLSATLYQRTNYNTLLNPVVVSVIVLVTLLLSTSTPYEVYFEGAQFVHFLLGPATVALAIPLYRYHKQLTQMFIPLSAALLIGSFTGIVSAIGLGYIFNLTPEMLLSLGPKSVTTPIAMGIAEQVGGLPSLTTVFVIFTGIVGALLGSKTLNLLRIRDQSIRGFTLGLSAHGLGIAAAFQEDQEAGAFAGLAMGLNGAATSILLPILIRFVVLG